MPAAKVGGTEWHQEGGDWLGQVIGWTLFILAQWSHGQKLVAMWGKQRTSASGFHLSSGDTGDTPTFNSPPRNPLYPKSPSTVVLQQPQEEAGGSSKL